MIDWEVLARQLGCQSEQQLLHYLYEKRKLSINELATLFKVSTTSICYRLRKNEITLRSQGGGNNDKHTVQILAYIDPRVTWQSTKEELASLLDVAPITIYKVRRRLL